MNWRHLATATAVGAASLGMVACGGAVDDTGDSKRASQTPDGEKKNTNLAGKGDAWNYLNNPERFETELTYKFSKLKNQASEGYTEAEVWPATYWPTYKDNINNRWQGEDTLSPAEKYDKAFNEWKPEGGFDQFMSLQPFDTESCNWDDSYYEKLGPAARAESKDGNWVAHNGRDDDGDGVSDKNECGYGEDKDYDGVETWWGLCHAWVPATILEEEPEEPVTVDSPSGEVTFQVSDIKALLIEKYDRSESYMVGGRCNSSEVERDETTGRVSDDRCRDVNAGSFHVLITNFLGLQGRPIAEDRVYDYEVWNQPIIGYKIDKQEKLSLDEVQSLLNTDDDRDEDSTPETAEEEQQTLRAANNLTRTELENDAGLRPENAEAVLDYRNENGSFEQISTLESEVGSRGLSRLLDYAYQQNWVEDDDAIYSYNENAESFVEVEMSVDYVTESHPSTEPLAGRLEEYTRTDEYHYILELDSQGKIIGGEWVGRSREKHPDFLWLPTGAGGGNQHIDLAKVRDLLAKSTGSDDSNGEGNSVSDQVQTFESNESRQIPDGNYRGASSTIDVEAEGNVKSLTLNVDIEHSYRGDIAVLLYKEGTRTIVYKGWTKDQPWKDDVKITGKSIDGFGGLPVQGEWRLRVVDITEPDAGTLKSWSIKTRLQQ